MVESTINYYCYPRTATPPKFADELIRCFRNREDQIATVDQENGLKSDNVLETVRPDLIEIGFDVEAGKKKQDKIHRPVLFGENGEAELRYEVDAYHKKWKCGLEIEAGRAWKGNAIYRNLIQASMMVQVETLAMAVPNLYTYSGGENPAFDKTKNVVDTL